jgi:hypothetical protein
MRAKARDIVRSLISPCHSCAISGKRLVVVVLGKGAIRTADFFLSICLGGLDGLGGLGGLGDFGAVRADHDRWEENPHHDQSQHHLPQRLNPHLIALCHH